jgi:hypothetical protein
VIADAVSRGLIENNLGTRTTKGIFNFGANVSIDLGRESASAISEFKTGLRTAADIYAERGQDFESAMRQRAIEAKLVKDLADEYDVTPDTISDISLEGMKQANQAQAKPTEQGEEAPKGQEGDADMLGGASLNGAQVSSLINVINAVAMGAVSKEGAVSIITAAFPTISPDQARAIIAGVNIGVTIPTTKEEKQQIAKDQGEDEGGDQKPIPEDPIDPSSEELQAKEKKTELDCGTGAGGFQPGNSCARGGGIQSSIRDATPSGYGPSASSQEKTKEQRMRGESIDDAINRKVGYQVDNGLVKINEDKGGWVVSVAQPEGSPRKFRSSSRQQAINQAYEELYPDTELVPHPSDSEAKPQKKSKLEILESLDPASIKMLIEGMMGGIELAKYDGIDFTPPQGARDAAKRALDVRETKPPSQRGMTAVGIARARDLMNGVKLSPDTARRMKAFFDRHEVDKNGSTWDEQGKGWQAWNGWGGDAGYSWARKVVRQMNAIDKKT